MIVLNWCCCFVTTNKFQNRFGVKKHWCVDWSQSSLSSSLSWSLSSSVGLNLTLIWGAVSVVCQYSMRIWCTCTMFVRDQPGEERGGGEQGYYCPREDQTRAGGQSNIFSHFSNIFLQTEYNPRLVFRHKIIKCRMWTMFMVWVSWGPWGTCWSSWCCQDPGRASSLSPDQYHRLMIMRMNWVTKWVTRCYLHEEDTHIWSCQCKQRW